MLDFSFVMGRYPNSSIMTRFKESILLIKKTLYLKYNWYIIVDYDNIYIRARENYIYIPYYEKIKKTQGGKNCE